jgi:hypothetical protein
MGTLITPRPPSASATYEQDFYAWIQEQVALLRTGRLAEIDIENIAEELESMGRSEKRELSDRLAVLLMHLLKWRLQPGRRGNSWRATIKEQRRRVRKRLEDSPSLKHGLEERLVEAFEAAVLLAISDTGLDEATFPVTCPFTLSQVLDETFWPD